MKYGIVDFGGSIGPVASSFKFDLEGTRESLNPRLLVELPTKTRKNQLKDEKFEETYCKIIDDAKINNYIIAKPTNIHLSCHFKVRINLFNLIFPMKLGTMSLP